MRRLLVAEEQGFIEFRTLKISPLKNSALRRREFLLKELVDFAKSVVPNVKDPFKQRGEALAIFFWGGLLTSLRYSYTSSKKYILLKVDICISFDRRYVENSEADTIIPLNNNLSYPMESFATITRWIRDHHAELSTQRDIVVLDRFLSDFHPERVRISQKISIDHWKMIGMVLSLESLATARSWWIKEKIRTWSQIPKERSSSPSRVESPHLIFKK